ncbi:MAG: gliding-motility protein MglA [Verrucomicrobia bacterium]|nr:gliding-motility protein MglA [Verrucomicrobiota bacterium]
MPFVNLGKREINFKVVYYGPPLCGKTTNLEYLHAALPPEAKGKMTMLATQKDRTLYFDFLPLTSDAIKGFTSRFQLYTVPGQAIYNQTRRIVLTGLDGIVFVADSQWEEMENNALSFQNLKENLATYNRTLDEIPYVLQYNKRDLPNVAPVEFLDFLLNQSKERVLSIESVAVEGVGVYKTLNSICKMVMAQFIKENKMKTSINK